MTDEEIYNPSDEVREKAYIKSLEEYEKLYKRSIEDPDGFWGEIAEDFTWFRKWDRVLDYDFHKANIKWFEGGKTNICYNCLDRNLETRGDKKAIIWEGNSPDEDASYTYKELHDEVCKFATVLRNSGIKKGDRVAIYLQMIPQLPIAMLACARIGAVHSIVFGAFSPDALKDRINDSACRILITQDTALRGNKNTIPMKTNADKALESTPSIEKVIVVRRTGLDVPMKEGRDFWWDEEMSNVSADPFYEEMDAEDPLFVLYTSGSTGKPKGVLH
ncbi:acetyl-coenzyme A synthetase, partial [Thermoplasmatales archaeon ex4484_6]